MWSNQRKNRVFGDMMKFSVRVRTTNKTLGTTPGDPDLLSRFIASKAPDAMSKAEEIANTYLPDPGIEGIPDSERDKMITMFPMGKFVRDVNDPEVFYDPIYDVVPDGVEVEECILPFIWNYQIRGSFKESIAFLQRASKEKATKAVEPKDDDSDTPDDVSVAEAEAPAEPAPKKRGRKPKSAAAKVESKGRKFACTDIKAYKKTVDGGWFIQQRRIPMLVPDTWVDELGEEHQTYNEFGRLPTWTRPLRASTAQGERTCIATSEFVPAGTEYYFTIGLLDPKHKAAMIETLDFKEHVGMLQWRGGGHGTFIWTTADENGHPTDEEI